MLNAPSRSSLPLPDDIAMMPCAFTFHCLLFLAVSAACYYIDMLIYFLFHIAALISRLFPFDTTRLFSFAASALPGYFAATSSPAAELHAPMSAKGLAASHRRHWRYHRADTPRSCRLQLRLRCRCLAIDAAEAIFACRSCHAPPDIRLSAGAHPFIFIDVILYEFRHTTIVICLRL